MQHKNLLTKQRTLKAGFIRSQICPNFDVSGIPFLKNLSAVHTQKKSNFTKLQKFLLENSMAWLNYEHFSAFPTPQQFPRPRHHQ